MNIDNNEMPEPTEEYPSHMVEETADEEEITDHQAVADVLSNGELYEGLTEERLREVVEEILEDANDAEPHRVDPRRTMLDAIEEPSLADRGVTRIDVSQIPPGMTLGDAVEHYQATGTLITNATDTAWVNLDSDSTSASLTEAMPMMKKEVPEEAEKPKLTPEQLEEARKERRLVQIIRTQKKESIRLYDMILGPNDLIISASTMQYGIMHTDLQSEITMVDIVKKRKTLLRRTGTRGRNNRGSLSQFTFDKRGTRVTMNVDVSDDEGTIRRTRRDVPRIYPSQLIIQSNTLDLNIERFVIVDKNLFLQSRGRTWKIKYRTYNVSPKVIMKRRNEMMEYFREMDYGIERLSLIMSRQFSEDEYEIFYNLDFQQQFSRFQLMGKYLNITIKNSIELTRYIGEMIIGLDGTHYKGHIDKKEELLLRMSGGVYGTRMTFTPTDAVAKYQHSHLSSAMSSNMGFCTGGENYRSHESYDNELDVEMTFVRLKDFISWESLEGGPHMNMENLSAHGTRMTVNPNEVASSAIHGRYKQLMIEKIHSHEQGFNVFKDCFILQADSRGNLRYIVDLPKFYTTFISLFAKKELETLSIRGLEPVVTYRPGGNFHKLRDGDLTNPANLRRRALQEIKNFNPLYMNGRYVRTRLIDEMNEESVVLSPNPFFMRDLAKYIQYNLTIELEHDSSDNA